MIPGSDDSKPPASAEESSPDGDAGSADAGIYPTSEAEEAGLAPADTVIVAPRRHLIAARRTASSSPRLDPERKPANDPSRRKAVMGLDEATLLQTRLREHNRGSIRGEGEEKFKKVASSAELGSVQWARSNAPGLSVRRTETNVVLLRGQAKAAGGSVALGLDSKRHSVSVAPNANALEVALRLQIRLQRTFDVELAETSEGVLLRVTSRQDSRWSS